MAKKAGTRARAQAEKRQNSSDRWAVATKVGMAAFGGSLAYGNVPVASAAATAMGYTYMRGAVRQEQAMYGRLRAAGVDHLAERGAKSSRDYVAADAKFKAEQPKQAASKPGYKDEWTDSRGRHYVRRNTSVRTAQ